MKLASPWRMGSTGEQHVVAFEQGHDELAGEQGEAAVAGFGIGAGGQVARAGAAEHDLAGVEPVQAGEGMVEIGGHGVAVERGVGEAQGRGEQVAGAVGGEAQAGEVCEQRVERGVGERGGLHERELDKVIAGGGDGVEQRVVDGAAHGRGKPGTEAVTHAGRPPWR